MRNYRAKRDLNSRSLVACYLAMGCTWADLSAVGAGIPDGAVGCQGVTDLVEIKNPEGKNVITPNQVEWHRAWRGSSVRVVRTLADVEGHVADMRRRARGIPAATDPR